ncbi:DUF1349 domain-containing protein [Cylindrospermopsis curvispora]|nr:DUF1349 domain-containing protein [Cylindrospermopsis curvispora]
MTIEPSPLTPWSSMQWHNPPAVWQNRGDQLWVKTGLKTDFWRTTHYGFIRDSGHCYYREVLGNFQARICFSGQYQELYDQAGLMVRVSKTHWLKCGIEYVDGIQYASTVVTRDRSDWSVAPLVGQPDRVWFEVRRRNEAIAVLYSLDGEKFVLSRLTDFPEEPTVWVGPVCASPEREGFEVTFESFTVELSSAPVLNIV